MRRLLALVACSILATSIQACEKKIIYQQAPAAEEDPEAAAVADAGAAKTAVLDPLILDLGSIPSGVDTAFDIPTGALGFNITIEGTVADYDQSAPYGIQRIIDPKGKIVHDDFTPLGGSAVTSTAEFDTIAAASIPQGEGTAPIPGKWVLRVGVQGSTRKVTVKGKVRVQSSGDGEFHGGRLDLHVHVPDGLKVGTTTLKGVQQAKDSPGLKQRIDTFFKVFSQLLEIDRGDVTFHAAPSALEAIDGSDELLDGFAASSGTIDGTQAFHILFTNEIALSGKPIAAGISPGIPGAATIFGRGVSTIIVTTSESADFDALAMVHETGHFFGLNHTTEFSGGISDPLTDTPKCTTLTDPPTLASMKSCPDRSNIMFPATAIEAPIYLSVEQKRVYRGSPIYKAYPPGTQRTQSLEPSAIPMLKPQFRVSGGPLSPVEVELSLGFCGLNKLDPEGIVRRNGHAAAIDQLRAAAADADLSPIIRGRASLALEKLGVP
jgi:hypothetical protein